MSSTSFVDIWIAVATTVTAGIALWYTICTHQLLKHSQELREDQAEPNLVVFLLPIDDGFEFWVENTGPAPAFECTIRAQPAFTETMDWFTGSWFSIGVMGPRERRKLTSGKSMTDVFKLEPQDRIVATKFKTRRGRVRTGSIPVDPQSSLGHEMTTERSLARIASALERASRY